MFLFFIVFCNRKSAALTRVLAETQRQAEDGESFLVGRGQASDVPCWEGLVRGSWRQAEEISRLIKLENHETVELMNNPENWNVFLKINEKI